MDILVVGGGIGGLTTALAVARDGHQVRVLEKAAQFAELGAGLQLAPNATRVLARLGVLDRVLDVGVRPRRLLLRSAVTAAELTADQPVCSGFAAYRGTARIDQVTARSRLDEVVAWIGPDLHFGQYPLRAGQIYNQVAVFRSPKYRAGLADGEWGGPDELDAAFAACCPQVREATGFLWRDRWWPMYDRESPAARLAALTRLVSAAAPHP